MGKIKDLLDAIALSKMSLQDADLPLEERQIYINNVSMQIDQKIKYQALKEVLMSKYKQYYHSLIEEGDADDILPLLKEIRDYEDAKVKTNYIFITVNPYPNIGLQDFINVCHKVSTKKWINQYVYVIEQRGENLEEIGKGFHFHMLLDKGDYRMSHLRREFISSFKKMCDTSNFHCFNISYCKVNDLKKRQNYIVGQKKDSHKHLKQEYDKVFRARYNLKPYYGELFTFEDDDNFLD